MTTIGKTLLIILAILISVVSGMIGAELNNTNNVNNVYDKEVGIEGLNTTTVESIVEECYVEDRIDKQLECVKTHVDRFYYYVVRPDNQTISYNTLMNDGGDCGNWAKFWEYFAEQYNYQITPIRISVDNETAHRFSIFSNSEGYCRVDQTTLDCFIYG